MTKKKAKWKEWLPSRPFNPSETIREWDPLNIDWDDETRCALCGKKEDCTCYDEYFCKCGKKNKDCDWPDAVKCPCPKCLNIFIDCMCDKPKEMTDEEWKSIKEILYHQRYDWANEIPVDEELKKIDEEED